MEKVISVNPPKNLSEEDKPLFVPLLKYKLSSLKIKNLINEIKIIIFALLGFGFICVIIATNLLRYFVESFYNSEIYGSL